MVQAKKKIHLHWNDNKQSIMSAPPFFSIIIFHLQNTFLDKPSFSGEHEKRVAPPFFL